MSAAGRPLMICPDCGVGNLRVTQFKVNRNPSHYQIGRLGTYADGGSSPTVVAKCTNGCGFVGEGPGTAEMINTLLIDPTNPNG